MLHFYHDQVLYGCYLLIEGYIYSYFSDKEIILVLINLYCNYDFMLINKNLINSNNSIYHVTIYGILHKFCFKHHHRVDIAQRENILGETNITQKGHSFEHAMHIHKQQLPST